MRSIFPLSHCYSSVFCCFFFKYHWNSTGIVKKKAMIFYRVPTEIQKNICEGSGSVFVDSLFIVALIVCGSFKFVMQYLVSFLVLHSSC